MSAGQGLGKRGELFRLSCGYYPAADLVPEVGFLWRFAGLFPPVREELDPGLHGMRAVDHLHHGQLSGIELDDSAYGVYPEASYEPLHDLRLEMRPPHEIEPFQGFLRHYPLLVYPLARHRVIDISHSRYAREDVYVAPGKSFMVTAAVVTLMVLRGYQHGGLVYPRAAQHVSAKLGMSFHYRELFIRELAGLVQDLVRHEHLAYVVEDGPCAEVFKVSPLQAHLLSKGKGEYADIHAMGEGIVVKAFEAGKACESVLVPEYRVDHAPDGHCDFSGVNAIADPRVLQELPYEQLGFVPEPAGFLQLLVKALFSGNLVVFRLELFALFDCREAFCFDDLRYARPAKS